MTLRVYFDLGGRLLLGPVGVPDVGEAFDRDGEAYEVTSIDGDGLGVASLASKLQRGEDEPEQLFEKRMELLSQAKTVAPANGREAAWLVGQTARNREAAGREPRA